MLSLSPGGRLTSTPGTRMKSGVPRACATDRIAAVAVVAATLLETEPHHLQVELVMHVTIRRAGWNLVVAEHCGEAFAAPVVVGLRFNGIQQLSARAQPARPSAIMRLNFFAVELHMLRFCNPLEDCEIPAL